MGRRRSWSSAFGEITATPWRSTGVRGRGGPGWPSRPPSRPSVRTGGVAVHIRARRPQVATIWALSVHLRSYRGERRARARSSVRVARDMRARKGLSLVARAPAGRGCGVLGGAHGRRRRLACGQGGMRGRRARALVVWHASAKAANAPQRFVAAPQCDCGHTWPSRRLMCCGGRTGVAIFCHRQCGHMRVWPEIAITRALVPTHFEAGAIAATRAYLP